MYAVDAMQPMPRTLRRLAPVPARIRVGRKHDQGELGVGEDGATVVKKPVHAELDAGPHDPAQGAEMVVDGVLEHEWIVRLQRRGTWWEVGVLPEELKEVLHAERLLCRRVLDRQRAKRIGKVKRLLGHQLKMLPIHYIAVGSRSTSHALI